MRTSTYMNWGAGKVIIVFDLTKARDKIIDIYFH